jgi:hypothetical protein
MRNYHVTISAKRIRQKVTRQVGVEVGKWGWRLASGGGGWQVGVEVGKWGWRLASGGGGSGPVTFLQKGTCACLQYPGEGR